ncbi:hypothetical protein NUW54_g514 [Trametes sanguinea]|uniref:Uncharacterized protein n=1 Tax=Trametes sanguinea TaxID=158606 RepID=A0ACC1QAP5_9APHY|nr:hypothetical protein NUW54_g514 [Trametes sanguinea]
MSLSVDDLVQSLKSNHIDQEAIELAALQAQLSQTLFTQTLSSPVPFNSPRAAPLNTPISCTPSSSISWEAADATWGNRGSTSSSKMRCSIDESQRESDDMDEDERMVEDLLFSPASPTSPSRLLPPVRHQALHLPHPPHPPRRSASESEPLECTCSPSSTRTTTSRRRTTSLFRHHRPVLPRTLSRTSHSHAPSSSVSHTAGSGWTSGCYGLENGQERGQYMYIS